MLNIGHVTDACSNGVEQSSYVQPRNMYDSVFTAYSRDLCVGFSIEDGHIEALNLFTGTSICCFDTKKAGGQEVPVEHLCHDKLDKVFFTANWWTVDCWSS